MDDHDQRFKELLQEFLPEHFALFLPDWAGLFDFAGADFLKQEAFLDPPKGEKRVFDLVVKLPSNQPIPDPSKRGPDHQLVVVHIEVESPDRAADIRPRMWEAYDYLRRKFKLPVLPICLFLRVGLDGIGWDSYEEWFLNHRICHFEYAYVGLPALDGATYASGPNLFGLALSALMKLPEADRARIKAEGLARIAKSGENEVRKYLLAECFENYFPLTPTEKEEFERIQTERFPEGKAMTTGWIEQGIEQGMAKGMRQLLRELLEKKFGALPPAAAHKLETLPPQRVREIGLACFDATSLKELGLTDE